MNLTEALVALDIALTGKSNNQPAVATLSLDLLDHELYLSDGGYSRVVFSWNTRRLFLTSNSRAEVKARWDAAEPERRAVETVISRWIEADGLV